MSSTAMQDEVKSVLRGDYDALYNMANMIRDSSKTDTLLVLYSCAFDAGVDEAALNMGTYLADKGRSVEAIDWFTKAYDTGDTRAAIGIAQEYEQLGDLERSIHWYRNAQELPESSVGHSRVARKLGLHDESRRVLEAHAHDLGEAAVELVVEFDKLSPQESFDLLEHHWHQGHLDVGVTFGNMLCDLGRVDEAITVYTTAAQAGDAHAAFNVGIELLAIDHAAAMSWIRKARVGGSKKAKKFLKKRAAHHDDAQPPLSEEVFSN